MSVRIVTDSTCDLPEQVIERHGIKVLPLYINVGSQSYLDGVELSRQAFYEQLPGYPTPPTTAVPGLDHFRQAYEQLALEGTSEILSIHISTSLSAVAQMAQIAAREVEGVSVTVIDSGQLSLGTGFMVQAAAQAADEGYSGEEILELVEDLGSRCYVFAALDTTEFLRRSGRVSGFQNSVGTLLKIKPLLKMHNGKATSEKIRTRKRAIRRLVELVSELGTLERLALVHANAPDEARELWHQAQYLFPDSEEPWSVNVTPVIGAHIGPGTVGFACLTARRSE